MVKNVKRLKIFKKLKFPQSGMRCDIDLICDVSLYHTV